MSRVRLNSAQVLARMRRGEALYQLDYCQAAFEDDARPGQGVLARLIREGKINPPSPHVGNTYALPSA